MSITIDHYAASVQGDREAFGEIVRQYQNLVSAVTYSITGNRQESEDLAQETFLTAWKNLPELREVEKLPAWLCGIARNLANNWIRRTQLERQNRCESVLETIPAAESTDESDIAESEREERIALLWATLKEIPLQFREPLVMYYQQNQSVTDIASALEISEANVRQRIARGRKHLKAEVERQVEKTLAHIRPSEHFTVAVLAALPIALTGEQVLAAGAAGATAAQSASSGGAGAGASLAAGISTFFAAIGAVPAAIFIGFGVILGIWAGIRNAPTLRARQWMLKATLGYLIVGSLCLMFVLLAILGLDYTPEDMWKKYRVIPKGDFQTVNNVEIGIHMFLVGILPVFVIVASYLVNRRWRKIVEEEMVGGYVDDSRLKSRECSAAQSPGFSTFWRLLYLWAGIALFLTLFSYAVPMYSDFRIWGMPLYVWIEFFFCFGLIILFVGIPFFYCAAQISKDHKSFAKYPPRLPNLLAILTGEEKTPRGFRNRINFWGDLVGIGWGLFVLHMLLFSFYFPPYFYMSGHGYFMLLLSLVLIVYFLFALFFAGIPRRRYWGMIFLGVSVLLIDTCVHFMISERLLKYNASELLIVYGLSAWYLLCFTLLGVAGLWVFRRKTRKPGA